MTAQLDVLAKRPSGKREAWRNLKAHYRTIRKAHLRSFFEQDPNRPERLSTEAVGLFLDYSKNLVVPETLELLIRLAEECHLRERIDAMFHGEKINVTEERAVLHTVLRAPQDASVIVDGENVVPEVHAVLTRMADFAKRVRGGEWRATPESVFVTSSTLESEALT